MTNSSNCDHMRLVIQTQFTYAKGLYRLITLLFRLESIQIADFGCGEARLARHLPSFNITSLDLVALKPDVIACDMGNSPLNANSMDIVVFCLSLMGTNLKDYLSEANRVLKTG